jgi:hypothetical protein
MIAKIELEHFSFFSITCNGPASLPAKTFAIFTLRGTAMLHRNAHAVP